MRSNARGHLGAFTRRALDTELDMVETRRAKPPQLALVEERAAGYQVDIKITRSRVPDQLNQIVAYNWLATREMQLHDA
jgi:hypothetical protein